MDSSGMWNLFFATGLPEAYLAARSEGALRGAALPPMPPPGLPGPVGIPPPGRRFGDRSDPNGSAGPL